MKRVLLVMDDCGAGDALRLSAHVHSVRLAYPDARIRMIGSAGATSVFAGSPDLDRVVESRLYRGRSAGWRSRARKAAELIRLAVAAGLDNELVITFWWGSRVLSTLARVAARGRRIGYGGAAMGAYDFTGDEMLQNTQLLEAAGIVHEPAATKPSLTVSSDLRHEAHRLLRLSGWDGTTPLVVMHTGSDWACQQWSPARWAAVGDALVAEAGAFLVLTGSRSEKDYVRQIRAAMDRPSASIAGETSVALLAAVMRRARLVVTVDSAAYVVARSQGVPAVVLAGPTHPERLAGREGVTIVKRMTDAKTREIDDCKRPRFPDGGCHNYSCPLAGLSELEVGDVLEAVRASGALEHERAAV